MPITKSLALNAGIRYDYYDDIASSTDPRAALVFRPTGNTNLKFIYGRAFRVPNVYEKYYSFPPNLPNPSLHPEKLSSSEFVWEQGLREHFWLSASAFHIAAGNLINLQETGANLYIYRNVQNIQSDGLELELKGHMTQGLEAVASYSFQQAKDRDSKQFLDNSPTTPR